jgi:phenolic acid decarboxylase
LKANEINDIIAALGAGIVEVQWVKQDGTLTERKFTRNYQIINQRKATPQGKTNDDPHSTAFVQDFIKVYDIEREAWRSFKPSQVTFWQIYSNVQPITKKTAEPSAKAQPDELTQIERVTKVVEILIKAKYPGDVLDLATDIENALFGVTDDID